MTKAFEQMLYLLGAGSVGYEISAEGMDMDAVMECARVQGVWPIVYKAAERTTDMSKWRSTFLTTIARSVARKEYNLSTLRKLEESGVKYCLLKGAAVATLYAMPECRMSGDMDIYIDRLYEDETVRIFRENGYTVNPEERDECHFHAYHPVGGMVEIHTKLYSKINEKIVFGGHIKYSGNYRKIKIGEYEYSVMDYDDELLYLTAHFIKHLVYNGCGIRQVVDLLLYLEYNKDKVDPEKYQKTLENLRYDKLVNVIKTIGAKYFNLNYPLIDENLAYALVKDMEDGGTFGFLADDRYNFYHMYCRARDKKTNPRRWINKFFATSGSLRYKLFPPQKYLLQCGYKYADKIILVPFAWINRLFDIALRRLKSDEDKIKIVKTAERMKLMEQLGMINK